jgi:hypothetical protein
MEGKLGEPGVYPLGCGLEGSFGRLRRTNMSAS